MSAMGVCRAPNTFKCGVAGAPVTSWDGYDTHYTGKPPTKLSFFFFIITKNVFLNKNVTWAPHRTTPLAIKTAQ